MLLAVPVTAKAARALYIRQTIIPLSLVQEAMEQVWPSVQLRFQQRRDTPRIQITVRAVLRYRERRGLRVPRLLRRELKIWKGRVSSEAVSNCGVIVKYSP